AAPNAAGDTMLTCECTTSGRSFAMAAPTARTPAAVIKKPNRGARTASTRTTRVPSTTPAPGVGVITTTSWPAFVKCVARSRRCSSMPPTRGAYQSQTSAIFTARPSSHGRDRNGGFLNGRQLAPDLLERLEHAIDLLGRMFGRHRHANSTRVRG